MRTLTCGLLAICSLLICVDQTYVDRVPVPTPAHSLKDLTCLTQAVYYEAGNQSSQGKEAVALVVLNRLYHAHYPSTICGIVRQSLHVNGKRICQFSFACTPHKKPQWKTWLESKIIATRVLHSYFYRARMHRLDHALWFHADYVTPAWSTQKVFVKKIGQHLFYKEDTHGHRSSRSEKHF